MTHSSYGKQPRLTARYNLISHVNFLRQRLAQLENDDQLADFIFEGSSYAHLTLKAFCDTMRDDLERIRHTFLSPAPCDDSALARELFVHDATLSFLES